MPGLGTSYGRGGATTFAMDMRHADSILIMGSNMAECHPVAFRWVIQAKTRERNPCTVIHADPRFTRTSAMANIYAPVRAGSDIVFLGALIKSVLDKHVAMFRGMEGRGRSSWSERERFFTLIESSTDFIGMWDLDGVPFFVNQAGLDMAGLDSIEQELDLVYGYAQHPERWKLLRYDVAHQETPEARQEALAFLRANL